jgi:hypothetical protein
MSRNIVKLVVSNSVINGELHVLNSHADHDNHVNPERDLFVMNDP